MTAYQPVVAVILFRDGRVLALCRSTTDTTDNTWCAPGGKIEAGETLEDAAAREVFEEVGLIVTAGTVEEVFATEVALPHGLFPVHYVLANATGSPEIGEPDKFGDMSWFTPADFAASHLTPADERLVNSGAWHDLIAAHPLPVEMAPNAAASPETIEAVLWLAALAYDELCNGILRRSTEFTAQEELATARTKVSARCVTLGVDPDLFFERIRPRPSF